ncbi:MAG: cation-efflux pump [Thermoplasmata archaeon]|nr:cation-efflux pump [Thermoplasmata archaeon]
MANSNNPGKFSLIPNYGDPKDPNVRAKYGYLEAFVSIIGNVALFIVKLILGLFINSIALIADSVHTLSDVGTSGVVIYSFKEAKKPPDEKHPHGHGRVEYIATIIIATLLVITGLGFIEQSIGRIINVEELLNQDFIFVIGIIIILTAIIKEFMAEFSISIGRKIKSDILIADAWHHRSDAISSVVVGISLIGTTYGYPLLDPVFGIIVSIIIIYVGIELIKESSSVLIGPAPDKEVITEIKKLVSSIKDVKGINKISVHDYGVSKVVSMRVNVKNNLRLDDAHEIADKIETKIRDKMNYTTIVHLEPKEISVDKKFSEKIVEKILDKEQEIISFHKIQIIATGKKEDIKMHIIVDQDMSVTKSHELCHRLESIIRKEYGACSIDIHFEPCGQDCKVCTFSCGVRDA